MALFAARQLRVANVLNKFQLLGHYADIMVVGFGIHNVYLEVDEIKFWVSRITATISQHPATSSARVVWMIPHHRVQSQSSPVLINVIRNTHFHDMFNNIFLKFEVLT